MWFDVRSQSHRTLCNCTQKIINSFKCCCRWLHLQVYILKLYTKLHHGSNNSNVNYTNLYAHTYPNKYTCFMWMHFDYAQTFFSLFSVVWKYTISSEYLDTWAHASFIYCMLNDLHNILYQFHHSIEGKRFILRTMSFLS